ncbi:MAG TPA: M48 family peptidase, partial [Actinomycetota bacterium]|nr:M48 family peptidase [Actinomycetota bacterium]
MSTARAALVIIPVAVAAAACVALLSVTPASMRAAPEDDRAAGASFTDEQIARHGRFRAPMYAAFVLTAVVEIVTLLVLARGPAARFVGHLDRLPGGFVLRAALAGAALALVLAVVLLPLAYVRGYAIAHAWGLSTQSGGAWLLDQVKSLLVAAVVAAVAAAAFFGVVRWRPQNWWVIGWVAFTALSALLVFLYPLVIAPLFNRFEPLAEGSLRARLVALTERAGIEVDDVLVADASRRTSTENAYVAGLGSSKRLVLYD